MQANLKVALIRHTLSPEETVALGARLCYSRATIDDLTQRVSAKDQTAFVQKIMGMGHESVLEHASFTFGVEGVSRVLLAQLTRHRIASFSVQSLPIWPKRRQCWSRAITAVPTMTACPR